MSEDSDIGKTADAVKSVSDTARKALDTTDKAGRFLYEVFGELMVDSVGILSDQVKGYRLRNLADIAEKNRRYLEEKGVKDPKPVSPRVAVKLLDEGTLEDDESLRDKFARLLAEALDPQGEKITRAHADALLAMTSKSFVILDYCWRHQNDVAHVFPTVGLQKPRIQYEPVQGVPPRTLVELTATVDADEDDIRLLIAEGLLKPYGRNFDVVTKSASHDDRLGRSSDFGSRDETERVTVFSDVRDFVLTDFGRSFCRSVGAGNEEIEADAEPCSPLTMRRA